MELPPPFSWLWSAWMAFSKVLGMIMSKIILTVLWIVGFGVYAIIAKVIGLFGSKMKPATYWNVIEKPTDMAQPF